MTSIKHQPLALGQPLGQTALPRFPSRPAPRRPLATPRPTAQRKAFSSSPLRTPRPQDLRTCAAANQDALHPTPPEALTRDQRGEWLRSLPVEEALAAIAARPEHVRCKWARDAGSGPLGRSWPATQALLGELLRRETSLWVRQAAATELVTGNYPKTLDPALLDQLLADESPLVRAVAGRYHRSPVPNDAPHLLRCARDPDPQTRWENFTSLCEHAWYNQTPPERTELIAQIARQEPVAWLQHTMFCELARTKLPVARTAWEALPEASRLQETQHMLERQERLAAVAAETLSGAPKTTAAREASETFASPAVKATPETLIAAETPATETASAPFGALHAIASLPRDIADAAAILEGILTAGTHAAAHEAAEGLVPTVMTLMEAPEQDARAALAGALATTCLTIGGFASELRFMLPALQAHPPTFLAVVLPELNSSDHVKVELLAEQFAAVSPDSPLHPWAGQALVGLLEHRFESVGQVACKAMIAHVGENPDHRWAILAAVERQMESYSPRERAAGVDNLVNLCGRSAECRERMQPTLRRLINGEGPLHEAAIAAFINHATLWPDNLVAWSVRPDPAIPAVPRDKPIMVLDLQSSPAEGKALAQRLADAPYPSTLIEEQVRGGHGLTLAYALARLAQDRPHALTARVFEALGALNTSLRRAEPSQASRLAMRHAAIDKSRLLAMHGLLRAYPQGHPQHATVHAMVTRWARSLTYVDSSALNLLMKTSYSGKQALLMDLMSNPAVGPIVTLAFERGLGIAR